MHSVHLLSWGSLTSALGTWISHRKDAGYGVRHNRPVTQLGRRAWHGAEERRRRGAAMVHKHGGFPNLVAFTDAHGKSNGLTRA